MILFADYSQPLTQHGSYFFGKTIPAFNTFMLEYHIHSLRYMYFMCIQNAEGDYPINMSLEECLLALSKENKESCKPVIKKILIGEAPPPTLLNYFYNPNSPWTHLGVPGPGGYAFTGVIQNVLFPGMGFPTKLDFLIACAKKGFLILDLFPYAIPYTNRNTNAYRNACRSAWGFGAHPYPHSIKSSMEDILCCIDKQISIGFALKSSGEPIAYDSLCVTGFDKWLIGNRISLNPPGSLGIKRLGPAPVNGASDYMRVLGRQGLFGPCPILMGLAGF